MSRCGRCKGRGHIQPIRGIGQIDCPDCKGSGVKVRKATLGRNSFSIPVRPGTLCAFCGERPATEQHHAIPQNRVRANLPRDLWEEALTDLRAGVPSCRSCHDAAESDPELVRPEHLHPRFHSYVREWNFEGLLPRHLQEVAA